MAEEKKELSHSKTQQKPVKNDKLKKSASEVFQELKNVVEGIDYKLDEINQFVHMSKDKLFKQNENYRNEGRLEVLESLFELHNMIYRSIRTFKTTNSKINKFSTQLMEYICDILRKHGANIIIPQPGEEFNMKTMEVLKAIPATNENKSNTVAEVEKCGYAIMITDKKNVVQYPARVNVYKK